MDIYLSFVIGLIVTIMLIPPLMRYAGHLKLVDIPDIRKVHTEVMPRVGGIAIVIATLLSVAFTIGEIDSHVVSYLAACLVLFVFGVLDDVKELDYRWKFLGQIIASVIIVYGGGVIEVLPFFGLDPLPAYITIPLSVITLVGVTNAINLVDGLDGLAAGTTILSVSVIALLAYFADGEAVLIISLAICGSLLGFLRYNAFPARVFMGDTGSQFLGFSAGVLAIELTQQVNPALNPALPLLILGLPILDTVLVMIKRIRERRSMFSPDKNHLHHHLLTIGLDHNEAVAVIYVIQGFFVISAIFFRYYNDLFVVSLYLATSCTLVFLIYLSGRTRWLQNESSKQSGYSLLLEWVKNKKYIYTVSSGLVKTGLVVFLLSGSYLVENVPSDIGIMAAITALVMAMRLVIGNRLPFVPLRLFMYIAAALIVYLTGLPDQQPVFFAGPFQLPFFIGMAGFFLIAVSGDKSFSITTTDLLVLLMILFMVIFPGVETTGLDLREMLLKLIVLFYACELVVSSMGRRWNLFVASSLLSLVFVSFKGLLLV